MENRREDSSHEEIPEELMHDGELQPADLWTLSEMRRHWDVFEEAFPEDAPRYRPVAEFDYEAFLRNGMLAASTVSEAEGRTPSESIEEARQRCTDLVDEHDFTDALDALTSFEQHLESEKETANRELDRIEDETGPGYNELRWRVLRARADLSRQRHAVTRFRSTFVRTGKAPGDEVTSDEVTSSAHDRTVSIGRALIRYRNENDTLPDTDSDGRPFHGSKGVFKEWAGKVVNLKPSRVYDMLKETGCWPVARQGVSDGLNEAVERCIQYARQHSEDLKTGD